MKKFILVACILLFHIGYNKAEILTGKCGDNLDYSLNTETGVLSITGSGKMYNYEFNN